MQVGIVKSGFQAVSNFASNFRFYGPQKIMSISSEFGDKLSITAKAKNGQLELSDVIQAIRQILPIGNKLQVTNTLQNNNSFLKEIGFSDDLIKRLKHSIQAMVLTNSATNRTLFFLPIDKFKGYQAINLATHEFEHVLSNNISFNAKLHNFIRKLIGKEKMKQLVLENINLINEKAMKIQERLLTESKVGDNLLIGNLKQKANIQGLLKHLGLSSEQRLGAKIRHIIRKEILLPDNDPKNLKILEQIKYLLIDEQRAYQVGGEAARKYLGLKNYCSNAEMYSQMCKKAVQIIDGEIKKQKINRIKKFLGFKVRDFKIPKKEEFDLEMFLRERMEKTDTDTEIIKLKDLVTE